MINFQHAQKAFQKYVAQFDSSDDKIHLKIVHTKGVIKAAEYLGLKLQLSAEDYALAQTIALLHDIGRFRQLELYHSFDDRIVDHALLGVEILKENDFLRAFVPEKTYDDVIYTALINHNTYQIADGLAPRTLLHAQIIRDADKLDNYRVKETEAFETLFDISAETLNGETITPLIFDEYAKHHLIRREDRQTHLDMWLSYFAFMYDLNFKESLAYIWENNYLDKIFPRVNPTNPETKEQYQQLYQISADFLQASIEKFQT